jgi:glycosyltransferase involved in cell wall biosynthesis
MPLRIGVIRGESGGADATAGGSWTLTSLLSQALKDFPTSHQFIPLDDIAARYARENDSCAHDDMGTAIAEVRPDIVWFMSPPGFPASTPYICTVWDLEHRKQPYFPEVSVTGWTWSAREEAYRSVLPRASYVITGTEVGKAEIAHFYGVSTKNIKVIPFPAPPDLRSSATGATPLAQNMHEKGDFLFYPAQYWPHKNHANLLKALAILRAEHGVRLNLALTGSDKGNRDHVRRVVNELGLQEQVFDLGFVSREELAALYLRAVALVYPSFFGPDNLPPLEAFVLGCPVVAANVAGAGEQLGEAALLFDPADAADLATKIMRVREDGACRQRLIAQGAAIAAKRNPHAYLAGLCALLDEFEQIRRCWGECFDEHL